MNIYSNEYYIIKWAPEINIMEIKTLSVLLNNHNNQV